MSGLGSSRPFERHGGHERFGRHGRRLRGLQARLLLWFLAAIALALGASVLTTFLTSTDGGEVPTRVVSRHVQQRVARLWDDPTETEAYLAELRETTGLDVRVRRDPSIFRGRFGRPGALVFEDGVAYAPVIRHGVVVGALELRTGVSSPRAWRVVVALIAALLVLGALARRVSARLARPLEHVAATAEKFGSGDLTARTGVDQLSRRWVAVEVRDLGRAFDTMADRIARVVLEQRELLAAISHELRSPLGRARVALEIARERSLPPADAEADETSSGGLAPPSPLARSFDDVDRQLSSMDAILGDLLASARTGLADLRRETVVLVPWIEHRLQSEPNPIEVVCDASTRTVEVEIDPALLGRALHNLFANAWAHGHPKDIPLVVSLSETKENLCIAVRDRGPGFASDILPRAFDPFVTGSDSARSPGAQGLGLGLSLVRRIVEAHGGRVVAENVDEVGERGAVVRCELPRKRSVGSVTD